MNKKTLLLILAILLGGLGAFYSAMTSRWDQRVDLPPHFTLLQVEEGVTKANLPDILLEYGVTSSPSAADSIAKALHRDPHVGLYAIPRKEGLEAQIKVLKGDPTGLLMDIPKGSSPQDVLKLLQKQGFSLSDWEFKAFCRLRSCSNIQSGSFYLPKGAGLTQIFEIFQKSGDIYKSLKKDGLLFRRVTIPEGLASWEILPIIQKQFPKLNADKWESLIRGNPDFIRKVLPGVDPLSIKNSLEGFLLPETYQFPVKITAKELKKANVSTPEAFIISEMVKAHRKVWSKLKKKYPNSEVLKRHKYHGTLALAAIIEEEAAVDHERHRIAGVYYNRLKKNMLLQADPTVRFIFRKFHNSTIKKSELNSDNPYNTYKYPGLTPGPISNPGSKAIAAALDPEDHDYLYFVVNEDCGKEHNFSKNYAEHERKARLWRRHCRANGKLK